MSWFDRRRPALWLALAVLILFLWACLSPLRDTTREKAIDLGSKTVPSVVRLTLGVQDVLLLQNSGAVSQIFGQVRVLPGHVLRLPFEQAGNTVFACGAHPKGQVLVQVVEPPDPGLNRLRWRFHGLVAMLRYLPSIAP